MKGKKSGRTDPERGGAPIAKPGSPPGTSMLVPTTPVESMAVGSIPLVSMPMLSKPFASIPIVGIGASAGGLEALTELLQNLPQQTGMAFVVIQHLDPTHDSLLSEVLAKATRMPVREIVEGTRVEADHVYVIPPNADIGILKGAITLLPRPADSKKPRRPIDFFFRALAADQGRQAIGVVLSGTGSDGTEGLRAIKGEDGVTFSQDAESAKFSGMPESARNAGVVDFVLPISQLAEQLARVGRHPYLRVRATETKTGTADDEDLRKVVVLLRTTVGADFSDYKAASLRRRVERRMALRQQVTIGDYLDVLREDRAEAKALFEDILIHVTSFFRDPGAFDKLKEVVFPLIIKGKAPGTPIRIWVAGCSTGEEAYSIAITLLEALAGGEDVRRGPVQIFATDISEKAIEKARAGVYPEGALHDVSPERLRRFFTRNDETYRVNKQVRDLCAFVRHDVGSDPPFSKLDLICCRNMLIYFDPALQKRVLSTFHFGLNMPGYLMLGRAENPSDGGTLFSVVDKEERIFARTAAKSVVRLAPPRDLAPLARPPLDPMSSSWSTGDAVRRVEGLLLDRYAPAGVIVNDRLEILLFRGRTGPYLEPAPGQPQHNLLDMAREGLLGDLRVAIAEAKRDVRTVRKAGVRVKKEGGTRLCDLTVIPVPMLPDAKEHLFAVLFEDASPAGSTEEGVAGPAPALAGRPTEVRIGGSDGETAARIAKLEDELVTTKEYLHSVIEEHRRTNEEVVSSNEELLSTNEELQSLNEEVETAKEELQSTNEELTTLNEELQVRNAELYVVNSDLVNVLASVEIPMVIVDGARRIRRFTPKARSILNVLPTDVGRPIDDIKPSLAVGDLDQQISDVIDTLTPKESEVQDSAGRWYRLQIRPYLTAEKKIDGAVISVVDINALKAAIGAAEWARDYSESTVEAVQTPLVVLDAEIRVLSANEAFYELLGVSKAAVAGRSLYDLAGGAWDVPELRLGLGEMLEKKTHFTDLEIAREIPELGPRVISFSARPMPSPTGVPMLLLGLDDVTERKHGDAERARLLAVAEEAKARAEEANRAKDLFLATLSHELRTPLSTLVLQANLLRRGDRTNDDVKRAGEFIERAAQTQTQLIDDLLDVSRIVSGKLKVERVPTDLVLAVRAAIEVLRPLADRKSVALEITLDESLAPVAGDAMRLEQIAWNLLTNAVKFTPAGGRVSVAVERVGGNAQLRVSDTGAGIEPTFLPHLFERFSQEDRTSTRAHGGLGLGLSIVSYLVEAHGGKIRAESEGKGKGASFTVLIPLSEERPKGELRLEGTSSALAARPLAGVRILLVEDDPGTLEAMLHLLELAGADVRAASSAAQALEAFAEFVPEMLVCDIAMPGEDGYSLLGKIRARGPERHGDIPAIALTALAGEEDRRRALDAGFQQHMAKPVRAERLLAALTDLRRSVAARGLR